MQIFFSLLPVLAYWVIETYYAPRVAALAGIVLCGMELLLERYFFKHWSTLSLVNGVLMVFLGVFTFFSEDGFYFKLVPGIMCLVAMIFLVLSHRQNKYLILRLLREHRQWANDPARMSMLNQWKDVFQVLERRLAYFLGIQGISFIVIARFCSTRFWALYKTVYFNIFFLIYLAIELVILRRGLQKNLNPKIQGF